MVGADLANLANEDALLAARRGHDKVAFADFTDSLEKILLGAPRGIILSAADRERTAYHESGHALVGMLTPGADPVRKVSIVPRGQALGVTLSTPDSDRVSYSREELDAKIRVALGGRVAEEVIYGEITTGAESDIQQLTNIARQMVGRWGMSDKLGPVTLLPSEGQSPFLPGASETSPQTQWLVDQAVQTLIENCHAQVTQLLTEHRAQLDNQPAHCSRPRASTPSTPMPPPAHTDASPRGARARYGSGVCSGARACLADVSHRVVVIGGGFGGLRATQALRRAAVEVTLIDRRNFHLFRSPELPGRHRSPVPGRGGVPAARDLQIRPARRRSCSPRSHGLTSTHARCTSASHQVWTPRLIRSATTRSSSPRAPKSYSYFGHEDWREFAAEVKTLESAIAVRAEILRAFEAAEIMPDSEERQAHLTFVVVGAGPTGVEMSGQIAELAQDTLRRNFRNIDSTTARVIMVDALDRVLTSFPHSLSRKAQRSLEQLGVTIRLNRTVIGIDAESVTLSGPDGSTERIRSKTGHLGRRGHRLRGGARTRRGFRAPRSTGPAASPWNPTSPFPATPR